MDPTTIALIVAVAAAVFFLAAYISASSRLKAREELEKRRESDYDRMKDAFRALSAENSEAFEKRSEKTIADILRPVQDKFAEFSHAVKESQDKSLQQHSQLQQRITDLEGQSRSIGDEARNLANALTGYSKVQGDFGEMLLTDVLKDAGLTEGIHFTVQGVIEDSKGREIKSDTGKTMIPDVMINYPDDTVVIIDSKVSLSAYNKYMSATDVDARIHFAKEHVRSVQAHVEELKNKDYASYIPEEKRKVPYNIMFIPMEGAFRLMLDESPRLWQVAKDNNVLIVSQMTLIIVLNMIMMSWRQHDQEKNIAEVYKTAAELMSQLRNWMEAYVKVGTGLDAVRKSYDDSVRKLSESNQSALKKGDSMLGKIRKLEGLGLSPKASRGKLNPGARISGPSTIIPSALDSDHPDE